KKSRRAGAAMIVALGVVMWTGTVSSVLHRAPHMVSVVVRAHSGQQDAAAQLVSDLGGRVVNRIALIDGVVATVPDTAVPALAAAPSVAEVTANAKGHLNATSYDPASDVTSLYNTAGMDGA